MIRPLLASTICLALATSATSQDAGAPAPIDTHVHLRAFYMQGGGWVSDFPGAAEHAIDEMDQLGVSEAILMPTPFSPGNASNPNVYDYTVLTELVELHPTRLEFLGGGLLLNPMIHSIPDGTATGAERADDAPPGGKAAAGEAQGPLHAAGEDQDPALLGLFGAG